MDFFYIAVDAAYQLTGGILIVKAGRHADQPVI